MSTLPNSTVVFLLTGFSDWGKSTLLKLLFGKAQKERFRSGATETASTGHNFLVVPQSNDDLGSSRYQRDVIHRVSKCTSVLPPNFISAFCPTREPNNESTVIITNLYANCKIILMPIEHKWCGHAKLELPTLAAYYQHIPNLIIDSITSSTPNCPLQDLAGIIKKHAV